MSSSEKQKVVLAFNNKKSKSASKKKTKSSKQSLAAEFDSSVEQDSKQLEEQEDVEREPLVIPVAENKLKWKVAEDKVSREDAEAAKALAQEASTGKHDDEGGDGNELVIEKSGQDRDTKQYQDDLEELPDEPALDSESYQRVPISQFGAALLRGMGWQGDDETDKKNKKKESEGALPRPHRLGLGATPKLTGVEDIAKPSRGGRRPDQIKRQAALQKQQEEYAKQRERQLEMDKQRTMQNGSLVYVSGDRLGKSSDQRARIIQLVGVPGLNMVKVQFEGNVEPSIVKRGEIRGLVSREELDEAPFKESSKSKSSTDDKAEPKKVKREREEFDEDRRGGESRKEHRRDKDRKKRKTESNSSSRDSKRSREEKRLSWVINNIRVRVITEKLGRRNFKQKGVVVDVTPKGATIKMADGSLLDKVPERYLETALPKAGGKAVVLAGSHRFAKGQLLERNSQKATGVIQIYEDMSVLTLSLDDIAEWCGPLDDDLS